MVDAAEWMPIGRIAGPFGLRGEIKVDLLTDFPERFRRLSSVYIGPAHSPYEVTGSRRHGERVLLRLNGVETPEHVTPLRGLELSVPRSEAVELPPDHYFLDDLLGAQVLTATGEPVGPIREVLRTGSNDVFVIGKGRDEILIPSIRDAIRSIDLQGRTVVVEPWVVARDE